MVLVAKWRMALLTAAEDELEYSNQPEEDEEYVCLPIHESTVQEEEEYVCFPSQGNTEQLQPQEEEEQIDEEQQVLWEGRRLCNQGIIIASLRAPAR